MLLVTIKITEAVQKVVVLYNRTLHLTYCNAAAHANIPAVCTHALYTDCDCTVVW